MQSRHNKNVTRLTTQGCDNIVISWLYRTCWNNFVTCLIIPTTLLQVVNSLFQTCRQLGTSIAKTTCWQTCHKMWDFCLCILEEYLFTWWKFRVEFLYMPTFSNAAMFMPKCAKCLAKNGSSIMSSSAYENISARWTICNDNPVGNVH
jgi:hypothetical protein